MSDKVVTNLIDFNKLDSALEISKRQIFYLNPLQQFKILKIVFQIRLL